MAKKKEQKAFLLPGKTIKKIESIYALTGNSRNQIVEQAVDFYHGYLTSELSQDFLCSVLGQKVEGIVGTHSDPVRRNLFKQGTEINVLTRILASKFSIPKDEYERLRKAAVDDMKTTKGIINIYEA